MPKNSYKTENLAQTRDLLLPRLMSGKVSVEHLMTSDFCPLASD